MGATQMVSSGTMKGREDASEGVINVLVIEDEEALRNRIERELTKLGYSVIAVASPIAAAAIIEDKQYQLVIVDIRFNAPNVSGDEFIRKNRDLLAETNIIAFTGYAQDISATNRQYFREVIKKGGVGQLLYECAESILKEFQQMVTEDSLDDSNQIDVAEWDASERKLIEILSQTDDKEGKIVWYMGRDLSVNELIEEVQDKKSEVGKSHIRMMRDWLKRKRNS